MELRPRDLAILRHVALYRLTLPLVVERLICREHGGNAGTILVNLAGEGLLRHHNLAETGAFPGPVKFFTLTSAGASVIGLTEDRGEKLGPRALRTHLATLWFCHLSDERRYRLEPDELTSLFGKGVVHPNVACCLAEESDGPKVYRIYETSTDVNRSVKQLRASIATTWESAALRPWLMTGDMGFTVLAETQDKVKRLNKAIRKTKKEKASVVDECHVIVRFAPSPVTLKAALAAARKAGS